ncbi:BTB/POZ fold [Elaphomyces granulatus]|jgi:hypothetical protein
MAYFSPIPSESQGLRSAVDEEMQSLLSSLYLNPKYSDLTIICGTEAFSAHRNIVCSRSAYFARACDGEFKEASSREIKLPDREPVLVKKTLEFLYTGDYTPEGYEFMSYTTSEAGTKTPPSEPQDGLPANGPSPDGSQPRMNKLFGEQALSLSCFHVLMYVEADYFQVDRLKALAKEKFCASFMDKPDRKSFQAAVVEVYRSTPEYDRGLKDVVIASTRNNLATLRNWWYPVLNNDLLRSVPEFAVDLCIATLDKYVEDQNPQQSYPYWMANGSPANDQKLDAVRGLGTNSGRGTARVRVCLPK